MAPESNGTSNENLSASKSQADLDAFFARIDLLRAENEAKGKALIKKWVSQDTQAKIDRLARRTQEEIDVEDAKLFRPQPSYLGVGASIPNDFFASEAQSGNKALKNKFFASTAFKASKARDADEKQASAKRGLQHDSSDDEEGRSGLGRMKKRKAFKTFMFEHDEILEPQAHTSNKQPVALPESPLLPTNRQDDSSQRQDPRSPTAQLEVQDLTTIGDAADGALARKKKKDKKPKKNASDYGTGGENIVTDPEKTPQESKGHNSLTGLASEKDSITVHNPTVINSPSQTTISKEQRKKEKKARKEERRRMKREEEGDEVEGPSL